MAKKRIGDGKFRQTTKLEAVIIRFSTQGFKPEGCSPVHEKEYLPGSPAVFTFTTARGPRETGEPPNAGHGPILFGHHWRSAAGRSKVRGATREDPRATGSRLSPPGSGRMTTMRWRKPDFAGQAFCCQMSTGSREGQACEGHLPLLLELKFVCSVTVRHSTLQGGSTDDFVAWIPHLHLTQGRESC